MNARIGHSTQSRTWEVFARLFAWARRHFQEHYIFGEVPGVARSGWSACLPVVVALEEASSLAVWVEALAADSEAASQAVTVANLEVDEAMAEVVAEVQVLHEDAVEINRSTYIDQSILACTLVRHTG